VGSINAQLPHSIFSHEFKQYNSFRHTFWQNSVRSHKGKRHFWTQIREYGNMLSILCFKNGILDFSWLTLNLPFNYQIFQRFSIYIYFILLVLKKNKKMI